MNSESATPTRPYTALISQPDYDPIRSYWHSAFMDNPDAPRGPGIDTETRTPVSFTAPYTDANLISSKAVGPQSLHFPALDIDFPCRVVRSTNPGHNHLFIDKALTWEQYVFLLQALEQVGILEKGFVDFSLARGASFIRTPWQKKVCNSQGLDVTTTYPLPLEPLDGHGAVPSPSAFQQLVDFDYEAGLPDDRGFGGEA